MMVSQPTSRAIYCTFALQYFGDGVPVLVVILDAMFLHPFRYGDVITTDDIADGVQILPELYTEPVLEASTQTNLSPFGEIVVCAYLFAVEVGQNDFHLSRKRSQLRNPVRIFWRFREPQLQDVRLGRPSFDPDGIFIAALMSEPLFHIRLQSDKNRI